MSHPHPRYLKKPLWVALGTLSLGGILGLGYNSGFAQQSGSLPISSPSVSPSVIPSSAPTPDLTVTQTLFQAHLNSLNYSGVSANVNLVVDNATLGISLQATGLSPGMHAAYVMTGSACSDDSQDQNEDGYVDVTEDAVSAGNPAIAFTVPLVSVTGQNEFAPGFFPSANTAGNLFYIQSLASSPLINTLPPVMASPSPTPSASASATPSTTPSPSPGAYPNASAGLSSSIQNLAGKVIEIRGIDATRFNLPQTVATVGSAPPAETIPVACGAIVQVIGQVNGQATRMNQ
jgi:hypothetical protein